MTAGNEMTTHNPALIGDDIPESWLNAELLNTDIEIHMTVFRLLVIHGSLALALKHPDYPPFSRAHAEEMVDSMELILENHGLEAPKKGWRC